jgi:hypothetical protein
VSTFLVRQRRASGGHGDKGLGVGHALDEGLERCKCRRGCYSGRGGAASEEGRLTGLALGAEVVERLESGMEVDSPSSCGSTVQSGSIVKSTIFAKLRFRVTSCLDAGGREGFFSFWGGPDGSSACGTIAHSRLPEEV